MSIHNKNESDCKSFAEGKLKLSGSSLTFQQTVQQNSNSLSIITSVKPLSELTVL